MSVLLKKIVILLFVAVTIFVNFLANFLPINGVTTGEISDSFPVYFVPAGYAFSIWGLIYIGLLIYSIVPLIKKDLNTQLIHKVFPWFAVSSAANIVWIFVWHYKLIEVTVLLMLVLLGSLIKIYIESNLRFEPKSMVESLVVRFPFSLYLGWISVATIANVTILLYYIEWDGFGISGQVWSAILISVACVLALLSLIRAGDIVYSGVIVWATLAIAVKFPSEEVIVGAVICSTIVLISMMSYKAMDILRLQMSRHQKQ